MSSPDRCWNGTIVQRCSHTGRPYRPGRIARPSRTRSPHVDAAVVCGGSFSGSDLHTAACRRAGPALSRSISAARRCRCRSAAGAGRARRGRTASRSARPRPRSRRPRRSRRSGRTSRACAARTRSSGSTSRDRRRRRADRPAVVGHARLVGAAPAAVAARGRAPPLFVTSLAHFPPLSRTLRRIGGRASGDSRPEEGLRAPAELWKPRGERRRTVRPPDPPVTTVDIEGLLAQEELRALLDACEQRGRSGRPTCTTSSRRTS